MYGPFDGCRREKVVAPPPEGGSFLRRRSSEPDCVCAGKLIARGREPHQVVRCASIVLEPAAGYETGSTRVLSLQCALRPTTDHAETVSTPHAVSRLRGRRPRAGASPVPGLFAPAAADVGHRR